jgi:UDPglucose--hexose-1-phosphate uridylyltransferase
MSKFVPDIKTQRWIVIAPTRVNRPDDHIPTQLHDKDPFKEGGEDATPEELFRIGTGEKGKPGWRVRVIPNKYPIVDIHEVIIHSPDPKKDIAEFEASQVVDLVTTYKQRYITHQEEGQVIIFCNHGEKAGASLTHPHSQLVVIPRQINLDALAREPIMNVVTDTKDFVMYCPDFSQWPYEVWISPKKEGSMFSDITDEEIKTFSSMLQSAIQKLKKKYQQFEKERSLPEDSFAYNYYIHHGKNWFIRIIPRLIHRAGFELGTGLSVNMIDPTVAAVELAAVI